jgi:hypothetical protein
MRDTFFIVSKVLGEDIHPVFEENHGSIACIIMLRQWPQDT